MRTTALYALAGFLFFLAILLPNMYVEIPYLEAIMGVFAVGVVVAVGLLKGSRAGLAFGLVSIPAYLTFAVATNYSSYLGSLQNDVVGFSFSLTTLLVSYVLLGVNFAIFGAFPAWAYSKSKSAAKVELVLVGTAVLSLLIVVANNVFLTYLSSSSYTLDDFMLSLPELMLWFFGVLALGGICSVICVRWLGSRASPLHLSTPTPVTPVPSHHGPNVSSEVMTVRCVNCGEVNAVNADFCSRCGARLREDETRIY